MIASSQLTTSVVMATYNSERFVGEQLASLMRQTCLPDEVIIADDGSSDGTPTIVRQFAETAPMPVRLQINQQRLDYAKNFLSAARQAAGELILFCDHDDIWHPEKIAVVRDAAAADDAGLISHDIRVFRDDPSKPEVASYGQLLRERGLSPAICFKGCALAIKASFVRRFGWPPETSGVSHDLWFALLATATGERRYVDRPLIDHRIHGQNASGWIASDCDRVRTRPGQPCSDPELMIDVCLKREALQWTDDFVRAIRADVVADRQLAEEFERLLLANWNWHHTPVRRASAYCRESLRQAKRFSRQVRSYIGLSRR